ncbi:MAG: hypothetical protein J6T57_04545 [Alphaproteobacteria bacterium]|nr:hypothetical protein [Alphaproteobacteria bacterium]
MRETILFAAIAGLASFGVYAAGENVVTSKAYVDSGLATKQNDIGRKDTTNIVVTYPTELGGTPNARAIETELGDDDHLVTRGAINAALNRKQDNITGTNGNVATYAASGLNTTGKPVYNSGNAYNSAQQAALIEAGHVNTGIVNGYNAHLTCADPAVGGDSTNCNLWQINTLSPSTAYLPHGN